MTTDLVPAGQAAELVVTDAGSAGIARAVEQMAGAHQLAKALANTSFVPAYFRGKPDECAAAILYGASIGMDPLASLRSIYVVGGQPGLYAKQMVAIVQAAGHNVWTEESTDESVTVAAQRRGSQHVERDTWTIARAERAGYVPEIDEQTGEYRKNANGKIIGNEKYLTDPQAMLYARAASTVCRRVAADALAGLDMSVEEMPVIQGEVVTTTTATATGRESAADALNTTAPAAAAQEAAEPGINSGQQKTIGRLMREASIADKEQALRYVADVIGRTIGSRKELSEAEAEHVIAALEADANADPATGEIRNQQEQPNEQKEANGGDQGSA